MTKIGYKKTKKEGYRCSPLLYKKLSKLSSALLYSKDLSIRSFFSSDSHEVRTT